MKIKPEDNDKRLQQFFVDNDYTEEQILAFLIVQQREEQEKIKLRNENLSRGVMITHADPYIQKLLDEVTKRTLSKSNASGFKPIGAGLFEKRTVIIQNTTIQYYQYDYRCRTQEARFKKLSGNHAGFKAESDS